MFAYEHQDFLVLFAVGNDGGLIPGGSSGGNPGATFKNGIAVGASYNSHENLLARFSSRGPSPDGRIKPELVAPGVGIQSAQATTQCGTTGMSGTSMATPLLAGTAALVRQYFMEGYYPYGIKNEAKGFTPMAALLKAVLMNSGEKMAGGEAFRQGDAFPNNDQGYGIVRINNVLVTPVSPRALVTEVYGEWSEGCQKCPGVSDKETKEYTLLIAQSTEGLSLRATMTWIEPPPGVFYTANPVVNDLDLSLEELGPNGEVVVRHFPNGLDGPDRKNLAERIIVENPTPGAKYILKVHGHNVAIGSQQWYGLAITGPLEKGAGCDNPGYTGPHCDKVVECEDEGDGNCYHVSQPMLTQEAAASFCEEELGHGWTLACPGNAQDNEMVTNAIKHAEEDAASPPPSPPNLEGEEGVSGGAEVVGEDQPFTGWLGFKYDLQSPDGTRISCVSQGEGSQQQQQPGGGGGDFMDPITFGAASSSSSSSSPYTNWEEGQDPAAGGGDRDTEDTTPQEACVRVDAKNNGIGNDAGGWSMSGCGEKRRAVCRIDAAALTERQEWTRPHYNDASSGGGFTVPGGDYAPLVLGGTVSVVIILIAFVAPVRRRSAYSETTGLTEGGGGGGE